MEFVLRRNRELRRAARNPPMTGRGPRPRSTTSGLPSEVSLFVTLALILGGAARLQAATIQVPPVTIMQLMHRYEGIGESDYLTFPGPGYASSGITAMISPCDLIGIPVEAPPR